MKLDRGSRFRKQLALLPLLLCGCQSLADYEVDSKYLNISEIPAEKIAPHEQILEKFFNAAIAGEVKTMVKLTSSKTHLLMGFRVLPEKYETDTVPAFRACGSLLPGGKAREISKKESGTGPGYSVMKRCSNTRFTTEIQFVVLKEGTRYVISRTAPIGPAA